MPSTPSARSRAAFAERAVAALLPMGPVRAQPMFGGHGLFLDDLMFALLDSGVMWFKGDDLNRDLYLDGGGRTFTYRRQGKDIAMSYYSVPDRVWLDRDTLISWAESAFAAAKRNRRRR